MANNSFDALVLDVNRKISEMNTVASNANGAAANARDMATEAQEATATAEAIIAKANEAATKANAEADAWDKVIATAASVEAGGKAAVEISETDGVKNLAFSLPVGATGDKGNAGKDGKSGVTFTLSGTKLYITTN